MRRVPGSLSCAAAMLLALGTGCQTTSGGPVAAHCRDLKPPLVTREEWGSKPHPIPESRRQTARWITLHHAGVPWTGKDPARFVRDMQTWGQNRPKLEKPPMDTYWPDLPYHYLIAPDGRIFEGRDVRYEPESNTKYELAGNIGVEMMGDFNVQPPTEAQLRSSVRVVAWLACAHGIALDHVRGHRDAAPGQTDCPGKGFSRFLEDGRFKRWVAESPSTPGADSPILVP